MLRGLSGNGADYIALLCDCQTKQNLPKPSGRLQVGEIKPRPGRQIKIAEAGGKALIEATAGVMHGSLAILNLFAAGRAALLHETHPVHQS